MKKPIYFCAKCGWEGEENEVQELPGYLWDYEMHDACPNCWEKDAIDSPLDVKWIEVDDEQRLG